VTIQEATQQAASGSIQLSLVPLLVAVFSLSGSLVTIGMYVGAKLQQLAQVKKDMADAKEAHAEELKAMDAKHEEEVKEIKGRQEREFRDLTKRMDRNEDSHLRLEGDVRVLTGDIRNLVGRVGELVEEMRERKKNG